MKFTQEIADGLFSRIPGLRYMAVDSDGGLHSYYDRPVYYKKRGSNHGYWDGSRKTFIGQYEDTESVVLYTAPGLDINDSRIFDTSKNISLGFEDGCINISIGTACAIIDRAQTKRFIKNILKGLY